MAAPALSPRAAVEWLHDDHVLLLHAAAVEQAVAAFAIVEGAEGRKTLQRGLLDSAARDIDALIEKAQQLRGVIRDLRQHT